MVKRVISLLMAAVILLSVVPAGALAVETASEQTSVDPGNVSIEGTNSFGTLLSQEISESQAETAEEAASYEAGYTVTDLTIEGTTATVTYNSLEDALLVVALYTEDGMQMLTSAKTTVTTDTTEATVEFTGDMPEYFLASAYLVDTYDLSPLCPAYDTPMYTREMQELLASTVEDYDENRVLNLDDNNTTNFAVYADTTKVIEAVEGANIVTSIDDEDATYIIDNADNQITSLEPGDIFAYPYAKDEILIAKIATIEVVGSKATITGTDLELEEVFTHIKIESESTTTDIDVAEENSDRSVTYNGMVDNALPQSMTVRPNAFEENIGGSDHISFSIYKKFEDEAMDSTVEVKGTLDLGMDISLSFYCSWSMQYMSLKVDSSCTFSGGVTGKITAEIEIPDLAVSPIPGIAIGAFPVFKVEASGEIAIELSFKWTIGFAFSSDSGFVNLTSGPEWDRNLKVKADLFIGVDLRPGVEIFKGKVARAKLSSPVGIQIECELNKDKDTQEAMGIRHDCTLCIEGTISFIAELGVEVGFLECSWLKYEQKFKGTVVELGLFYYSADYDELAFGTCPHCSYRTTFQVTTREGDPVATAQITVDGLEDTFTPNSAGIASGYLTAGKYLITASSNDMYCTKSVIVEAPQKVIFPLILDRDGDGLDDDTGASGNPDAEIDFGGILGEIDSEEITDQGAVVDSGTCGDNVYWTLYSSGLLIISGSGPMNGFSSSIYVPWYNDRETIKQVVIESGITSIGKNVFYGCSNLSDITIPDSVTYIGSCAFEYCNKLTSIDIPDSVTEINEYTFYSCVGLTSIKIPETIIGIGTEAFAGCSSLTSVTIPGSVTCIDSYAFWWCDGLINVSIGSGVVDIGGNAFEFCKSLTYVVIPDSITHIGECAFWDCDSLTDIYYEGTEEQWEQISIGEVSLPVPVPAIHYNSTGPTAAGTPSQVLSEFVGESDVMSEDIPALVNADKDKPVASPDAVYPGDYGTEVTDSYTLKTASFTSLVPEEQYVLLAMKSLEVEDPLAADNLLFIDQGIALEDGTLTFQYVQREAADTSYVVACGASSKNLENAEITFPKMTADGELQVVDPTVVYDGVTLIEGRDYVIVGTVDYTEAGTYTCYIRGVHNYTGMVECVYTVGSADISTVTYTSASISLAGDIGVNYYAQLSDDIVADEDAYMQFTVAGQAQIVPLRDAVVGTDGTYRFTCKVAAKQMTDEITGQMYTSTGPVGEAKVYSVKAYCDAAIPVYSQYAAYADLVALMEAMLNYGGYSQTQFGYNTANLANKGLDTTLPAITAADVDAYTHGATGSESGIGVASVSLLLESTTTIRFYFSLDGSKSIDEYTFYVDGVETTPVAADNGQYYVDKVNVAAKDLDEMVTVTVGGLTARYCGLSYVRQVAVLYPNYYSAALVNVAKALYTYNQAANAYFG